MTDFNKKGSTIAYEAGTDIPTRFSCLSSDAHRLQMALYKATGQRPKDAAENKSRGAALGCLERLSACLLQIERLSIEATKIQGQCPKKMGQMLGVRAPEVLFDFEALLFHARSALDLVTFLVCRGVYGQQCDRFSKLANVAADFAPKDARAERLQDIVERVYGPLRGILVDQPKARCLRSTLIHRSTVGELSHVGFTLHCPATGKRLALDTVLSDYALFNTTGLVGSHVAFFVLNALSIYAGDGTQLTEPQASLKWSHHFVDHRQYETTEEDHSMTFTVWKPVPSGMILTPVRLSMTICKHTY